MARTRVLCSNSNWACYEQQYAPNMRPACNSAWRKCCEEYLRNGNYNCNKEETLRVVSAVYEQYDSQVSYGILWPKTFYSKIFGVYFFCRKKGFSGNNILRWISLLMLF